MDTNPNMTTPINELQDKNVVKGQMNNIQPTSIQQSPMNNLQPPQQQMNMGQMQQPQYNMHQMPMNYNTHIPQFNNPTFDPVLDSNSIQLKDSGILFFMCILLFSTPIQDIICKTIPSVCSQNGNHVNIVGIVFIAFFVSVFFSIYRLYG